MDNYISDFSHYVNYLKDVIENTTIALQLNGDIPSDPIVYNIYDTYGDYIEESHAVLVEDEPVPVLVCIHNDGGTIDNASNVKTYLQGSSIEILAPMELADAISLIFRTIAITYSRKMTTIDNKPHLILIGDLPEFSDTRTDLYATERFQCTIPINFIVYLDAMLADETTFLLNNEEMKLKSWSINATDELQSDNKFGYSDARSRFVFNTTGLVLKIEYLYQPKNASCRLLWKNALTNNNNGQMYLGTIKIGDEVETELPLIHKTTTINAVQGSLIQMSTEFWLYSIDTAKAIEV